MYNFSNSILEKIRVSINSVILTKPFITTLSEKRISRTSNTTNLLKYKIVNRINILKNFDTFVFFLQSMNLLFSLILVEGLTSPSLQ